MKFGKWKIPIIVAVSIIVTVLLSKIFFDNTNQYLREKIKDEEAKISSYQAQRDSFELVIKNLDVDFRNSQLKIDSEKKAIEKLNFQLLNSQKDLEHARLSLSHYKSEYDSINKRISQIKQNSIKRSGQDLLNSLKKYK